MNAKLGWILVFVIAVGALCFGLVKLVGRVSLGAANSETQFVRALVQSEDWERLAHYLDDSLVSVPAGEFTMGTSDGRSDERPKHQVYLDPFQVDRFEVTNVQYRRFLQSSGKTAPRYWANDRYPVGQADYPVVGVSWDDADAYCAWAGKRLPTEAEWEKSCRSVDGRVFPWGDVWDASRANVDVSVHTPHLKDFQLMDWGDAWTLLHSTPAARAVGLRPIGSFPASASAFGVMDLVGNASEWVADWYNWSDYSAMPVQNPIGQGPPWNHSLRGSAWFDPQGAEGWAREQSRCSARNSSHETEDPRTGFRCAKSISY